MLDNVKSAFEAIEKNKDLIRFGIISCAIYIVCEVWLESDNSGRVVPNQTRLKATLEIIKLKLDGVFHYAFYKQSVEAC